MQAWATIPCLERAQPRVKRDLHASDATLLPHKMAILKGRSPHSYRVGILATMPDLVAAASLLTCMTPSAHVAIASR